MALGGSHPKRRHTTTVIPPQTTPETDPIVPYNNPLENLQEYELYLMNDDFNYPPIDPSELPSSSHQNRFPVNSPIIQSMAPDTQIIHPSDPHHLDPLTVNDMLGEGFTQPNASRAYNETNTNKSSDFGNPFRLSSWPFQASPYTCSCCQNLREISHTNGADITKLEIHGRLGVICHAVLEAYNIDLTANQNQGGHEYKMFDFCKESLGRVKDFLEDYCKERKTNGYIILQDPLSPFYEAVCVGLRWEDGLVTDDLIPDDSGDHQINQPNVESSRSARLPNKNPLSVQRERTGKLTIKDLVNYFNLPIESAAKEINVCPTVIKRICRKSGLSRWPYRKLSSIEKKISIRARDLTSLDPVERGRAQAEVDTLRQEIANIYSTFNV